MYITIWYKYVNIYIHMYSFVYKKLNREGKQK